MKILNKKIQKLIVIAQLCVMMFGFSINVSFAQSTENAINNEVTVINLESEYGVVTPEQKAWEYNKANKENELLKIITDESGKYTPEEIEKAQNDLKTLDATTYENRNILPEEKSEPASSSILTLPEGVSGKDLAIGAGVALGTTAIGELLSSATNNNRTTRQVLNRIGSKVAESTICGADFNFGVVKISGSEFCDMMGLFNRVPTGSLDEGLDILSDDLSEEISDNTDIRTYILQVVNFFLGFLGLLAVIMIIYAGFKYVTSNGNSDQSEGAKKIITYAVVGIFVILGSFALVNTVINFKDEHGAGGSYSPTNRVSSGTSSNNKTYSNSTGSYGATKNSLQEFSGIMNTLAPTYRDRFEKYVQFKEEVLPALDAREEILNKILNGETDIEVTPEISKTISSINSVQYNVKNINLEDFTDNEKLEENYKKAKTLQGLYASLGHSIPELDNFVENAEMILYGDDDLSISAGHAGSPVARLSFSPGSKVTDANNNPAWIVKLSGTTSTVPNDTSAQKVTIDYDMEVEGDEESVNIINNAKWERIYPIRDKNYALSLKITNNIGESDTVIRKFKVTEEGVTAVDNNSSEGEAAIARLKVIKNTDSSSNLSVTFNPINSIPAEDATITSFYIDTNLNKDSDEDGYKENDHNLYGSNLKLQNYTYPNYGTYNVKLVVTDSIGNQDSIVQEVKISEDGLDITENEPAEAVGQRNVISGIELLDYVRYGYNLNNYSLDLTSIRQALEVWYETSIPHTTSISSTYNEMMFALDDMIKTNNYDTLPVRNFANKVVYMLEEIANIPSIVAKINAKPSIRGKAPFTVELNAVESYAPESSGISIGAEGYCWEGIITDAEKGIERAIGNSFYGPVQTITFNKPGSYLVRLSIPANGSCDTTYVSESDDLLSGSDTMLITVLPPSSDIKLNITPPCLSNSSTDAEWGDGYNASGSSNITNGQACYMSLADARKGISFDPSGTTPASGRTIQSIEWNIGNDHYGPYASPESARVTHTGFGNSGTYYVNLDVIDSAGEKDRFTMDINVMEIVANILASPGSGNVNTKFAFSATGSQSDNSTITNYSWIINYQNSTGSPIYTGNEKSFEHQFEQPGKYNVTLTVTDSQGRTATTSKPLEVISEPPVATFTYKQKSKSQPSTYILDARKSYDVDSDEIVYCEWVIDGKEIDILGGEGECYNVIDGYGEYSDVSEIETSDNEIKQLGTGIFEYTFDTDGPHEIMLIVRGDNDESADTSRVIEVPSALSVDFGAYVEGEIAYATQIGQEIRFTAKTRNATSYDWGFGEGTKKSTSQKDIKHVYRKAGEYTVTLRAFNDAGDSNSITKRVVIGKQDNVIANYETYLKNQTISQQVAGCDANTLEVNRNESVTFDASSSINAQGDQGNMNYSWDFGDGIYAEGVRANHAFTETSGKECFPVTLKIHDKKDPTIQDETTLAYIKVVNAGPILSGIRITTPQDSDITPFNVSLSAINPKDIDGRIIKYTWWYYIEGDNTKRGLHETITSYTQMPIVPIGAEGQSLKYYFVVQIEDNEGKKTISTDELGADPFISAITGHNVPPTAFFSVDKVIADAGEEIHFTASIKDSAGNVIPQESYLWDFDGNGKYDDTTSGSFASYRYNEGGKFNARLKVTRNGLSATYSMPITIEADSLPPRTAFTYKIVDENEVMFINASQADASLGDDTLTYAWDFDTNVDSDSDGDPTNDTDSTEKNPAHIYAASQKTYNVSLTATDIKDISNEAVRPVNIDQEVIPANINDNQAEVLAVIISEPVANKYNGQLYLENSQEVKLNFSKSRGSIAEYRIDKNIYFDSDGDGDPENDVDNRNHESFTAGGEWLTYYDSSWAPITTKLEIITLDGQTSVAKLKINFGEKNPTYADINFNTDNGLAFFYTDPGMKFVNQEVKFDASQSAAQDIENYIWDFNGDDTVDLETAEPVAIHKYNTVGEKTVKLITKSKGNISSEYTAIVRVSSDISGPTANFEYVVEGNQVSFYNQSIVDPSLENYPSVYEWKFYENDENPSIDSNTNPVHIFSEIGQYKVVLTVIDYYGQTNSIEKTIDTTSSTPQSIEEDKPADEKSGSILGTIFSIVIWGLIILVIVAGGIGAFSFAMFRKNYPGHSFADFLEYIQMTLAGEEYGPAPSPALAQDTKLLEKPTEIKPIEEPKTDEKIGEEKMPEQKIEPKLNTSADKTPDWLKPKTETETKVDETQENK